MEIIILPTAEEASLYAARLTAQTVRSHPHCVLGLATGSTPLRLYKELARIHCEEGLDFAACTTFNLDEYLGIPPDHPASYRRFMQENLFAHLNIPSERSYIPDGLTPDVEAHCRTYEAAIARAGGIDLQILGIGTDGHIGFNEPSSSLASRTRIKTLTERTRSDNARFFASPSEVPYHVITMGIGTIMESKQILLLAFGKAKAHAVAAAVEGPVSASVPASALQWHPNAKIILDQAAADELHRQDYYRHVFDHKPTWQRVSG